MLEENADVVARVSKTFGQNGELTLNLYNTFPQDYDLSEPLFVVIDKLAVPLFCDRFQRRGQSGAVVKFGDIDTERRASELIGHELYFNNPCAEEEEEEAGDGLIYLEDLVGYRISLNANTVSDSSESELDCKTQHQEDRIEEFIDGENPLFKAEIGGREVWIPAVEEFITDIDEEAHTIEFDLPDGLLDLYQ